MQGAISYASGVIHHVKLKHLKPGHTYFYRCGDPDFPGQWSHELNFTMPRATGRHEFPFRLGVIADIGQTYNSTGELARPEHFGPFHTFSSLPLRFSAFSVPQLCRWPLGCY